MLNYIGSELYKTFRRKYTKIALAVIALLCIAGNALVRMVFRWRARWIPLTRSILASCLCQCALRF